ncbi:MAG: class I tRNA ligase family protein, partial [Coriobacteriia bacterium]|nr:class I tRNA ligase family protein [Coriobacteriia bacterium]
LTSIGAYGMAPWENLMTHGFTVDGDGRKMSKSIGNVISPIDITEKFGADIVRLWVATSDSSSDVGVSDEILTRVSDSYRNVRNSLRFLLGNTYDFDPTTDTLPHSELLQTDKYWMIRLADLHAAITKYNDDWKFYLAQRAALDFLGKFSALYLDMLKDRLYSDSADSCERRSAQTVLAAALSLLVRTFAPVLAFTCEETWSFMSDEWKLDASGNVIESVHLCDWPKFELNLHADEREELIKAFEIVLSVREQVTLALEGERTAGLIGKSQEAFVLLSAQKSVLDVLHTIDDGLLEEMFIVSGVKLELMPDAKIAALDKSSAGLTELTISQVIEVAIEKSTLDKCPRCWNYRELGTDPACPEVCARCAKVLTQIGPTC